MPEMEEEVRWKQRFQNYLKALSHLQTAVEKITSPNDLQKDGTIQRFEFTHELAWKVMKDYLEYEGMQNITGSRSATRAAYNAGLIAEGQEWMNMIESRNKTVHTYIDEILEKEYNLIVNSYFPLNFDFAEKMKNYL